MHTLPGNGGAFALESFFIGRPALTPEEHAEAKAREGAYLKQFMDELNAKYDALEAQDAEQRRSA